MIIKCFFTKLTDPHNPEEKEAVDCQQDHGGQFVTVEVNIIVTDEGTKQNKIKNIVLDMIHMIEVPVAEQQRLVPLYLQQVPLGHRHLQTAPGGQDQRWNS